MTNEEKLLKLLGVAQENGWQNHYTRKGDCIHTIHTDTVYVNEFTFSLNDLVINFEEDKMSFIEALWQTTDYSNELFGRFTNVEMMRLSWTLKPTSQRLDWLFDTFSHLLN